MGWFHVYRRPWTRAAHKFVRWRKYITHGVKEPGAGDALAFMGPSIRAFACAGPAADAGAVLGAAIGAAPHAGSATGGVGKLRPGIRSDTHMGSG